MCQSRQFFFSHTFAEAQKDAAKHVRTLKINVLCNVAVLFKYQVTILNMDQWNTSLLWFLHSENLNLGEDSICDDCNPLFFNIQIF
jgi:hypothetical protein